MTYYGDKAPNVLATVITLAVIAYVVFGLRVYTRSRNKAWGKDDWCMVAAIIPFTALTISCLGGSFSGIGVHQFRLSAAEETIGLKFFFLFEVFYCAAIIPTKMSISFMLMRIASGRKIFIYSLYAITAMFTLMNLVALFYIIFQCSPVQYAWDTFIPHGSCKPAKILADIYYATTAINIATDWFCAILPIPLLWNVQLNRNAKLSVGFILSLGALASLSACIRLVYTINLTHSAEYLFGIADVLIWGYAENGVGVIVGCLATLRPLFLRVFDLGRSSVRQRTSKDHHTTWTGVNARPRGKDDEWVALYEPSDANRVKAKRPSPHLRYSGSEEHILGNRIKVTNTVLQDISYREEDKNEEKHRYGD